MFKRIRRKWLKWFPRYTRTDLVLVDFNRANQMIGDCYGLPDEQQWHVADPENRMWPIGSVWLEKRRRVLE